MISFDPTGLGAGLYTGNITLNPFSTFPGLFDVSLDPILLSFQARIMAPPTGLPEPNSAMLIVVAMLVLVVAHRGRRRAASVH